MKNMKKVFICAALLGLAFITGCTEQVSGPSNQGSDVAMRTEIDNSGAHSSIPAENRVSSFATADSIVVLQAAFICSNMMIRSDISDSDSQSNLSENLMRPEQFILYFDANGIQYVSERLTFPAVYNSARFDVHWAHGRADSLAGAMGPLYLSLFGGTATSIPGATIVIKGFTYVGDVQVPFIYETNMNDAARVFFETPLNVTAGGNAFEVMVKFKTANVFSSKGILMDPHDPHNAAQIDLNLKTALRGSITQM
jgi:hypothetical protein